MKNKLVGVKAFFPLIIFILILVFLWKGLARDPHKIPSPLIGKPIPNFNAKSLFNPNLNLSNQDLTGKVILLNVFATWCISCRVENSVLLEMREHYHINVDGLNYKDNRQKAIQWLKKFGNPYKQIIFDPSGNIAINFGVYGTPETFIIDAKGIIRNKYIGPISPNEMKNIILPILSKLKKEK